MPRICFLAALGLFSLVADAACADGSSGVLASACNGCHGTNGASTGSHLPTIGGLDKDYLSTVLADYRAGARPSAIMGRIAKGYDEESLRAIAGCFAEQRWESNGAGADAKLAQRGKAIHAKQCEGCHEDGGRVQDEENPRLAGQRSGYLQYMLEQCRMRGTECQPKKMGERVMRLDDSDLQALAHFYASQK